MAANSSIRALVGVDAEVTADESRGWETVAAADDLVILRETATGIETLPMTRSAAESFLSAIQERAAARPERFVQS